MNIATYFEQIAEILGYILTDVDKEYIAKYSNYVVIIIAIFTSIIVVSRIVAKIKAVNEYIDDGVALFLASTKEEKDISKLLFTILPELYDIIYDKFGRKEFFSLEVLLSQGIGRLSLFLPRKVYNLWASRAEFFRLKVVTEEREKFVDSMSPSNYCTILELAKDYIYPLDLEGRGKLLDKVNSSELMMFQMVCRPAGRRWEQRIEEGLEKLKKGKDFDFERKRGAFTDVIFTFFNSLANILTFLVHGSGPKKELDSRKINKSNQDLSRMLEEKLGSRGFENQYRLVLAGGNEEGTYGLAERFMDIMCMDTAKKTNFFVFEKLQSKLSTNFKNDIILANIDKLSVDILNEKEIVRVIEHLI